MTTVKAIQTSVGDYGRLKTGQTVEVTDRIAKELAASGLVEIVSVSEKVEQEHTEKKEVLEKGEKKILVPDTEKKKDVKETPKTSIKITESDSVKRTKAENSK